MKLLLSLILTFVVSVQVSATYILPSLYLKKVIVRNDTVFVDHTPYCIFKAQGNGYVISTLDINEIMYVEPFTRNGKHYYKISISPLRKIFYAEKRNDLLSQLINDAVNYQLIEDSFFSAYGANTFIKDKLAGREFIPEWQLPKMVNPYEVLKQNISWAETPNNDSTVILADGVAAAYYTRRHWREFGVESFITLVDTKAEYRYFIYKVDDNKPLAEVRVADWWKTKVTIITPDGWTYQFENIPKTDDLMRVATKLVLLKEALNK